MDFTMLSNSLLVHSLLSVLLMLRLFFAVNVKKITNASH